MIATRSLLVVTLGLLACAACPGRPDPCLNGACSEGEGEGEGEGEPALEEAIAASCDRAIACGFADATCVDEETEETARYTACAGFTDAYVAIAACLGDACDATCDSERAALDALLVDCVIAPIADEVDAYCARVGECFAPDPGCLELQALNLVPAGPGCTGAHDAFADAVACYEDTDCAELIDCDPFFNEYFDALFFCSAGPPPEGEGFPEDRVYEHSLIPKGQECNPEFGNCSQTFEACTDQRATYIVTDIILEGLYAQLDDTVTLELTQTGGETAPVVTFTVEDEGNVLVRDDGAIFAWRQDLVPFCD